MFVVLLERLDFIFPMTTITRVFPMIPKKNIHPKMTGTITTSGPKVSVVWFVSICSSVQITVSFRDNPIITRNQEFQSKQKDIRSETQSNHSPVCLLISEVSARWPIFGSFVEYSGRLGNAPAGCEALLRTHIIVHCRVCFPGKTLER